MGKERGAETRKKKKEASFFNRNYKSHNGEEVSIIRYVYILSSREFLLSL